MFQNPYADLYSLFGLVPGQQQGAMGTDASGLLQQLMQRNLMQDQGFWGQLQAARGASAPLQSSFMPQAQPAPQQSSSSSSGLGGLIGGIASFFL